MVVLWVRLLAQGSTLNKEFNNTIGQRPKKCGYLSTSRFQQYTLNKIFLLAHSFRCIHFPRSEPQKILRHIGSSLYISVFVPIHNCMYILVNLKHVTHQCLLKNSVRICLKYAPGPPSFLLCTFFHK